MLLNSIGSICAFGITALLFANSETSYAETPEDTSSSMSYPNSPVSSILDFYESITGKHLVRDATLASVPPISLMADKMDKAQTIKIIEATLLLNGVALVPIDDKTSKVVVFAPAKNPRSEGLKLYTKESDLPADDEVVSYYMPLDYVSAQEIQGIFTQTAPVHPFGAYVVAPSAQALILTESTAVVRQLITLKETLDVPAAHVASEYVQLNTADAEKTADFLNKLLGDKNSGGNPGAAPAGQNGATSPIVPANVGNDAPLLNEHNLLSGDAHILADPRSNRLFIITRPVNMPLLKEIIAQLDRPDAFTTPTRRPLKYVLAQDILPAVEAALAQGKDEEDQIKKTSSSPTGASNGGQTQQPAAPTQSGGSGGSGSATAVTAQLQAPAENNIPTVDIVGRTRLMADNRSNSIIIFGSPDAVARVSTVIDELDRRPLQVYLATVIGELTVKKGFEFGIDILQKFQKVGQGGLASSSISGSTSSSQPEPSSLTSTSGFPLTSGLTLYGAIGSTLDAYVKALETTDRYKIISRPSVYTTNNKLAVIASGSQVPVPGTSTSGYTGSSSSTNSLTTTSSIQYENVLLQLSIIPLINANHEVTLKIRQTNNSLGSYQTIGGNSVPTILTQELNTEITVPDKATVVIGGLISDSTTHDVSSVPFLGDIPVIGNLFKDTTKNSERDELIIMIQPTVIETAQDQILSDKTETQRTILGQDAIDSGKLPDTKTKDKPSDKLNPWSN